MLIGVIVIVNHRAGVVLVTASAVTVTVDHWLRMCDMTVDYWFLMILYHVVDHYTSDHTC
jgi:hypothetical protein